MKQLTNTKISNKRKKVNLIAGISLFAVIAIVLASVGVFFANRNLSPVPEVVYPTEWNTDVWNGSTPSVGEFNEGKAFAKRGDKSYTINSAAAFVAFVNLVNDPTLAKEYNYFKDYTIYLNKIIDLQNKEINSIGVKLPDGSSTFQGTFDGGYYSIVNAKLNGGLFGYVENATIKNVGLYNPTINSTEEYVGAIVNSAKNTNVENVYVRLGSISGANVAGLVGEVAISENGHYIKNSFADTSLNGAKHGLLAAARAVNEEQGLTFTLENCYFTSGEGTTTSGVTLTETNLLKNPTANSFSGWNYKPTYGLATWCNYSANNSQFSFNLPILCAFNKVFANGAFYENVLVDETGKVTNADSLASAMDSLSDNSTAELNIIISQVVVDQPAALTTAANLTINSAVPTTLLRGANNTTSLIVASENSNLTLGSADSAPITIDGNKDYVLSHNLQSGAAVIAMGQGFEMHNTTIKNNVNNTDGFGGGLFVYDVNPANGKQQELNGSVTGCQATNGGGVAIVGSNAKLNVNVSNCHATGNGGGVYINGEKQNAQTPALTATLRNFGYGKKISLTDHEEYGDMNGRYEINGNIGGCSSDSDGGGIFADSADNLVWGDGVEVYNNFSNNNGGGAYIGNCFISWNGGLNVHNNDATSDGGGIYFYNCCWSEGCSGEINYNYCAGNGGGIYFYWREAYSSVSDWIDEYGIDTQNYKLFLSLTVMGNIAIQNGGGIYLYIDLPEFYVNDPYNYKAVDGIVLEGLDIQSNFALGWGSEDQFAGNGGGLYLQNYGPFWNIRLQGGGINNNYAVTGGGVYIDKNNSYSSNYSVISFETTIVDNNHAILNGGGIYYVQSYPKLDFKSNGDDFINDFSELVFNGSQIEENGIDIGDFQYLNNFLNENSVGDGSLDLDTYQNDWYYINYEDEFTTQYLHGAGIYFSGIKLQVNGSVTSNFCSSQNFAGFGGGIYVDHYYEKDEAGSKTFNLDELTYTTICGSGTISNNTANYGGGIYINGNVDLSGLKFENNGIEPDGDHYSGGPNIAYNYFESLLHIDLDSITNVGSGGDGIYGDGQFQVLDGANNAFEYIDAYSKKNFDETRFYGFDHNTDFPGQTINLHYKNSSNSDATKSLQVYYLDEIESVTAYETAPTGYKFTGWATSSGGQVTKKTLANYRNYSQHDTIKGQASGYDDRDSWVELIDKTYDYYAVYESLGISVTFDANNGKFSDGLSTKSITQTVGSAYSLPANPTRTGYNFSGWYTKASGGTEIGSTVTESAQTTFYAHWSAKSFTVYTGGSGGSVTTPTNRSTKYYDSSFNVVTSGSASTGYEASLSSIRIYSGSSTSGSLLDTLYSSNTSWKMTGDYYSSIYIYVTYTESAISYSISYSLGTGGVNGTYAPKSADYDSSVHISNPTRTGYHFTGWTASSLNTSTAKHASTSSGLSSASTWSGTTATKDEYFKNLRSTTGSVTLTANWEMDAVDVTFNANGGQFSGGSTTQTVQENINSYYTLPSNDPTRTGYTFTGWYTEKSSGSKVDTNVKVTNSSAHTLWARWQAKTYDVEISGTNATASTNASSSKGTFDSALTITWAPNIPVGYSQGALSVTIFEGDSSSGRVLATSGTSTTYTMTGTYYSKVRIVVEYKTTAKTYTLHDSSKSTDYGVMTSGTTGTFNSPLNITWRSEGATGYSYTFVSAKVYSNSGLTDEIASTKAATETSLSFTMTGAYYSDVYVVIKYTKTAIKYNISYSGNVAADFDGPKSADYDKVVEIPTPVRTGYTFKGWTSGASANLNTSTALYGATNSSLSAWTGALQNVKFFKNLSSTQGATVTLTANWDAIQYTVAFAGESVSKSNQTATYDTALSVSAPTRNGYNFAGWTSNADAGLMTGAMSGSSAETANSAWNGAANTATYFKNLRSEAGTVTLTATWTAKEYTLTYAAKNGKFNSPASGINFDYDEDVSLSYQSAGRTGYSYSNATIKVYSGTTESGNALLTISGTTSSNFNLAEDIGTYYSQIYMVLSFDETPNEYTITFAGDGITLSEMQATYDAYVNISAPTRDGYNFAGWTADGLNVNTAMYGDTTSPSTKWTDGSQKVNAQYFINLTDKQGTTVTLTANWDEATYHIFTQGINATISKPTNDSTAKFNQQVEISWAAKTQVGYRYDFASVVVYYNTTATGSYIQLSPSGTTATFTMDDKTGWHENVCIVVKYDEAALGYTVNTPESQTFATLTVAESGVFDVDLSLNWQAEGTTGYKYENLAVNVYSGTDNGGSLLATYSAGNSATFNMKTVGKGYFDNIYITVSYTKSPIKYNISFVDSGNVNTPTEATFDSEFTLANPTKAGYQFTGWTAANLSETAQTKSTSNWSSWSGSTTFDTNFKNLSSEDGATVTLTANWQANTYSIVINKADGTDSTTETVKYDEDKTIANPTREGYTFVGWTASGLTNTARISADGNSWVEWVEHTLYTHFKNLTDVKDGRVTLTADWQVKNYTITFNATNGKITSPANSSQHAYNEDVRIEFESDNLTGYKYSDLQIIAYASNRADEAKRIGNYSGADYITFNLEDLATTLTEKFGQAYFENVHFELSYQETAISYNIDYSLDGGNAGLAPKTAIFDQPFEVSNATKEGYTFVGWKAENIDSNTAQISETGAEWASWNGTETTLFTHFKNLTAKDGETVKLIAVFQAKTYTITIEESENGEILTPTAEDTGTFDQELEITWKHKDDERYAYTFTSLIVYGVADGKTQLLAYTDSEPTSPVKFKMCDIEGGKYYPEISIKVEYSKIFAPRTLKVDANGGTVVATQGWQISADSKTATKPVRYNDAYGELPTVKRDGYVFDDWYDNPTEGNKVNSQTVITDDITIYAHWKRDINALDIKYTDSFVYTGSEIKPDVTITDGDTTLQAPKDYTVDYSNNTNVTESATITITPQGDYAGEVVVKTFKITPKSINSEDISVDKIADVQFDDSHTPAVVVKDNGRPSGDLGYIVLMVEQDYTTEYSNYTNATKEEEFAKVTILGSGNYNGSRTETYKILPRNLADGQIEVQPSEFKYNGQNQTPTIVVKVGEITIPESDYTITFKKQDGSTIDKTEIKDVGSYTIEVNGQNNAQGKLESSFSITALTLTDAVVSLDKTEFIFNREAQKPTVQSITIGSYNLTEYSVQYLEQTVAGEYSENENPTNAGSYKIVVTSTNSNILGKFEKEFTISPASLTGATITLTASESEYDGQAKDIQISSVVTSAENNSLTLNKEGEYSVSYSREVGKDDDKTNVGAIIVTITATSKNFDGSATATYRITPATINGVQADEVASVVYNRNEHRPEVKLTYKGIELVKDVDYTLSWANNTDAGEGEIIITAKPDYNEGAQRFGNFKNGEETFVVKFTINPATIDADSLTLNPATATYTAKPHHIVIESATASEGELTLKANEYTVKYYRNYGLDGQTEITAEQDFVNVGIITVEILSNSKNFVIADETHVTAEYTITAAELTLISLSNEKLVYNREEQKPSEIKVYAGDILLKETDEYTLKFYRNGEVSKDLTNAGKIVIKVELNSDNFVNTAEVENSYTIEQKNIQELYSNTKFYEGEWKDDQGQTVFDFEHKTELVEPQVYVGQQVFPIITFNEIDLVYNFLNNTDKNEYTYAIYKNSDTTRDNPLKVFADVGNYDLVITGVGNYTGTITKTYQVNQAELKDDNVRIVLKNEEQGFYYNGEPYTISPDDIEVYWTDNGHGGQEYKLGYSETDVSTVDSELDDRLKAGWTFYNGPYTYKDEAGEDQNTVQVNKGFINNENAGIATVFIKGLNNFFGVVSKNFEIKKAQLKQEDLTITLNESDFTYDSFAKTPKPTVKWNNKENSSVELVENVNYLVAYLNNTDAGENTAKVLIKNLDESEGHTHNNNVTFVEEIFVTFTIKQYNINTGSEKIYVNNAQTYSSTVVYDKSRLAAPELAITFKPNDDVTRHLENGVDYNLSYFRTVDGELKPTEDFTSVGEITIKITGAKNFTDELDYTYTITTKEIDRLVLASDNGTYNDNSQFENINLSVYSAGELVDAGEYAVKYYRAESETDDYKNAGAITIKVTSANKNYTVKDGELTIVYTINKLNLNNANLTVDIPSFEYTGEQITPKTPDDFVVGYNSRTLTADEFEIAGYGTNVDKTTTPENKNTAYVLLKGKGNFEGEYYAYFEIVGIDLGKNQDRLKVDGTSLADYAEKQFVFDNKAHKYKPTITFNSDGAQDVELKEYVDINYTFYRYNGEQVADVETDDFTNAGKIHVVITGTDNYGGKIELDYSITPKSFADDVAFNISYTNSYIYTGKKIELVVNSITISYGDLLNYKLTDADYTSSICVNNNGELGNTLEVGAIDAGKYFLVITGQNNFKDSYKFEFEVLKKQLDESSIEVNITEKSYNGQDVTPDVTVSYNGSELRQGEDYTVTIQPQPVVNAGEYTITIEGMGNNFEGTITKTFNVAKQNISLAHGFETLFDGTSESYTYTYSGTNVLEQIKNALMFTLNETEVALVEGQDYYVTTTDENFVEIGSYSVVFNGKGNYENSLTINFEIVAKTLTDKELQNGEVEIVVPDDLEYTGEKLVPDIQVKFNGEVLTEGEDYTLKFVPEDVENAGSYDVVVEFKGNLSGEVTKEDALVVEKRNLNLDIELKDSNKKYYEGDLAGSVLDNLNIPADAFTYGDVTIVDAETPLQLGEQTVTWKFTPKPEYQDNYASMEGSVTVNALAVEIDHLSIELSNGLTRLDYSAYDSFVAADVQLTITVHYNNGTTKTLNSLTENGVSYEFDKLLTNNLLTVDVNKLIVKFSENEKTISTTVPLKVSPISVNLQFVDSETANTIVEGQEINSKLTVVAVEDANRAKLTYITYQIAIENELGETETTLVAGDHTAKLVLTNNNFVVASGEVKFYVRPTTIKAVEFGSVEAQSTAGFDKGVSLVVRRLANADEIREYLGDNYSRLSNIQFLLVIGFEKDGVAVTPENYVIRFKLSEFGMFSAYSLSSGDLLTNLNNTADQDGYVQLFTNTIGVVVLCEIGESDSGFRWEIFFIILLILLIIFIIFLVERIVTKRKRKKMVDELNDNVKAKA